jgi:hypothetical protein
MSSTTAPTTDADGFTVYTSKRSNRKGGSRKPKPEWRDKHGRTHSERKEYFAERSKREAAQDRRRENREQHRRLTASNVIGGKETVNKIVAAVAQGQIDTERAVREIEFSHRFEPLPKPFTALTHKSMSELSPEECEELGFKEQSDEASAKVLQELVRYHMADIMEHDTIRTLLSKTREMDGHTYIHWLLFVSRKHPRGKNKEEFLRSLRVLLDIGCSPLQTNKKKTDESKESARGETCIEAMFTAADKGFIPPEWVHDIYMEMMNPGKEVMSKIIICAANKLTPKNIKGMANSICWGGIVQMPTLVDEIMKICTRVSTSSKLRGFYNMVHETIQSVIKCFEMGPQDDVNYNDFFAVVKFSPETLKEDFTNLMSKSLMAYDPTSMNEERQCMDSLGAIIGEVGTHEDIVTFMRREITVRPMNIVTCLAHSEITEEMAQIIADNLDCLSSTEKIFVEFSLTKKLGSHIKCSNIMDAFRCDESVGEASESDSDDDHFSLSDEEEEDDVIVFDVNLADKYKVNGLNKITDKDILDVVGVGEFAEYKPACLDDVAYSCTTIYGKVTDSTERKEHVRALISKIVDSALNENAIRGAHFILTRMIDPSILKPELKFLSTLSDEKIVEYFESPKAKHNITELCYEFDVMKRPVPTVDSDSDSDVEEFEFESKDDETPVTVAPVKNTVNVTHPATSLSTKKKSGSKGKKGKGKKGKKGGKSKRRR